MSDEQSTDTTPETEATDQENPAQGTDWVKEARKWEGRAKNANAEVEELRKRASKLDEIEEAQKSAEQKREEEIESLRAKLAEVERNSAAKDRAILVERVAASKGVPARYLIGETEDDLTASADQFLEDAKTISKPVGYVPSQGEGEPAPSAASLESGAERARALLGK